MSKKKIKIPRFDDGTGSKDTTTTLEEQIEAARLDGTDAGWKRYRKLVGTSDRKVHRPTKPDNYSGTEEEFQKRRSESIKQGTRPQVDLAYVTEKRNLLKQLTNALDDIRKIQDAIKVEDEISNFNRDLNLAIVDQQQVRLLKINDYKKGILTSLRVAEMLSSGTTLLGMYSRYKNWANSANLGKRRVYNLLSKSLLPLTYANTGIDLAQTALTYPDVSTKDYAELGLDGALILGASDVFRNSNLFRNHGVVIDNTMDAFGGLAAGGDIVSGLWDFGNNVYTYINSRK